MQIDSFRIGVNTLFGGVNKLALLVCGLINRRLPLLLPIRLPLQLEAWRCEALIKAVELALTFSKAFAAELALCGDVL